MWVGGRFCKDHMVFRGRGEDQSTPKEYWGGGAEN